MHLRSFSSLFTRVPLVCILLMITRVPELVGAERPDFSGSYILTGPKTALKMLKGASQTLRVVQTDSEIEITRVTDRVASTNTWKLDGTKSTYKSPGGPTGTATAEFKGKTLILYTLIRSYVQQYGLEVQIRTKEQWKLSSDSKTLTIRIEVNSPSVDLGGFQLLEPSSEIYTRN